MAINNVTLNTVVPHTTGKISATDHESKNLQNQLLNEKQRLNHLSSDTEMSAEEKAKKRQEIRQQIAELNRKLRQQQLEQKEEAKEAAKEQEKKKALKEEVISKENSQVHSENAIFEEKREPLEDISIPVASIHKMFAADFVVQQERIQERVDAQKAGKENVLEAEMKLDSLYGTDTEAKREELSDMRKRERMQVESVDNQDRKSAPAFQGAKIIVRE
uniref:FlxA-like family protein n=1 Tax=Acetatifactor sp. TaxID=1872090 RepID=UPI0040564327